MIFSGSSQTASPLPPHALAASSPSTDPECVICKLTARHSFHVATYRFYVCARCDYVFIDPLVAQTLNGRSIFNDTYFVGGGAGYTNYLDEASLLRAHGARYGHLLARTGAHHVLDVGAAAGFILRGFIDAGCTGVGIEPNPSMAAYASSKLQLDVRGTTLEDFRTAERFDAVSMLQVIDHLEDVRQSFERVRALTKPGGWCLIEFGNRASVTARVLGRAWHEYAPPSVQRVFSLRALRLLLADYGFALHSTGHPAKYLRADHALSLLRYKAGTPIAQTLVAQLARAIPAGAKMRYIGDDITWALFAKVEKAELGAVA